MRHGGRFIARVADDCEPNDVEIRFSRRSLADPIAPPARFAPPPPADGAPRATGGARADAAGARPGAASAAGAAGAVAAAAASCSVCLEAYDDGAELRELPCGHAFHAACIAQWLEQSAICPVCRTLPFSDDTPAPDTPEKKRRRVGDAT